MNVDLLRAEETPKPYKELLVFPQTPKIEQLLEDKNRLFVGHSRRK